MRKWISRLRQFSLPGWSAPLILLVVSILAYGLLIPWLGLYSDDWVFLATFQKMGSAGLTRYFTTNRPFWGLFYQLTLPIIGSAPWRWHLFGLAWHWAAAVSVWWLVRLVWQRAREAALWVGMLFAVHPAFLLQPIALTVGHMYLVYTTFILSIYLLVLAQNEREKNDLVDYERAKPGRGLFWLYAILAFITSLINLMSMEYFLLLHLMQPVFLWYAMADWEANLKLRFKKVLHLWLPYLGLLIAVLVWRIIFFPYQTQNYQYLFLEELKLNPGQALADLGATMLGDWWATSLGAWTRAMALAFEAGGQREELIYLLLAIASAVVIGALLIFQRDKNDRGISQQTWDSGDDENRSAGLGPMLGAGLRAGLQMMAAGVIGLVIAGVPFWLTSIPVGIEGFHSRFAMPFIFGASLLAGGLLLAMPFSRWVKILLLAILLGFGISSQFREQNLFRREWITQKNLYWQLAWRVPALEPGTVVFSTELPLFYNASDYTQSAMFDWTWRPDPSAQVMDYALYYPNERLLFGSMASFGPGERVYVDHLGAVFEGSTSESVVVQVNDPDALTVGCLHVMDAETDSNNPFFPRIERELIAYSDISRIQAVDANQTKELMPEIFGGEPSLNHCYYFQKIDLAYQLGDYETAVNYFQQAVEAEQDTWLDTELVPAIGSFAHLGEWSKVVKLSEQMSKRSYYPLDTYVCNLWAIIIDETPASPEREEAVSDVYEKFGCGE